jgi:hypothetical protein
MSNFEVMSKWPKNQAGFLHQISRTNNFSTI